MRSSYLGSAAMSFWILYCLIYTFVKVEVWKWLALRIENFWARCLAAPTEQIGNAQRAGNFGRACSKIKCMVSPSKKEKSLGYTSLTTLCQVSHLISSIHSVDQELIGYLPNDLCRFRDIVSLQISANPELRGQIINYPVYPRLLLMCDLIFFTWF